MCEIKQKDRGFWPAWVQLNLLVGTAAAFLSKPCRREPRASACCITPELPELWHLTLTAQSASWKRKSSIICKSGRVALRHQEMKGWMALTNNRHPVTHLSISCSFSSIKGFICSQAPAQRSTVRKPQTDRTYSSVKAWYLPAESTLRNQE